LAKKPIIQKFQTQYPYTKERPWTAWRMWD